MAKLAGAIPGYETTFVTRNELTDEQLKTLKDRITSVITNFGGGEIVHTEDWGKRKLAYPIEKETRGQYTYFVYTGKNDIVKEVERNLRISEHVLRFLSVNLEKEFNVEEFKKSPTSAMMEKHEEPREGEDRGGYRGDRGGYRGDREDRGGYRGDRGPRDSNRDEAKDTSPREFKKG